MRQLTIKQRQRIAYKAAIMGYDLNDLEFRQNGIRYGYWEPCQRLARAINKLGIECIHDSFEDSDSGSLCYIEYKKHEDKDFTCGSNLIRYRTRPPNGLKLGVKTVANYKPLNNWDVDVDEDGPFVVQAGNLNQL